jgi:hypothetical protein
MDYADEEFLAALPALRLAFTYFTPREKHHLALTLLQATGMSSEPLAPLAVPAAVAAQALAFESRLYAALKRYGARGATATNNDSAREGSAAGAPARGGER